MRYFLDTNVLSDFARGEPAVMARLRHEAPPQLAVSAITEMEVEYGLARNPNLAPPIGAYDLLLTACALRRGLKVVTHNAREPE